MFVDGLGALKDERIFRQVLIRGASIRSRSRASSGLPTMPLSGHDGVFTAHADAFHDERHTGGKPQRSGTGRKLRSAESRKPHRSA